MKTETIPVKHTGKKRKWDWNKTYRKEKRKRTPRQNSAEIYSLNSLKATKDLEDASTWVSHSEHTVPQVGRMDVPMGLGDEANCHSTAQPRCWRAHSGSIWSFLLLQSSPWLPEPRLSLAPPPSSSGLLLLLTSLLWCFQRRLLTPAVRIKASWWHLQGVIMVRGPAQCVFTLCQCMWERKRERGSEINTVMGRFHHLLTRA